MLSWFFPSSSHLEDTSEVSLASVAVCLTHRELRTTLLRELATVTWQIHDIVSSGTTTCQFPGVQLPT